MVRRTILAVCAFGVVSAAFADQRPMEGYKSIVERNPFGLKDPVVPPLTPTNKPPAVEKKEDFYLTGISTIGDPKRPKAYLLSKDASKKLYDEKYYTLSIGDSQGDVTLKQIDPKDRRVLIAYQGEDRWLSMKDNSVPAPTGHAPGPGGAMPLVPGAPGAVPPSPNGVPIPLPHAGGPPNGTPQPTYPNAGNPNRRTPRSIYNNAANNPAVNTGAYNAAPAPTYGSPVYNAPGMATATGANYGGNPNPNQNVNPSPQSDAELVEQMAKMKAPDKFGGLPPGTPAPPSPF